MCRRTLREMISVGLAVQMSVLATFTTPQSAQARWYDRETGTYHARARVYRPALGRYLQCDPNQTALLLTMATRFNAQTPAVFANMSPGGQYIDGPSLYEFVRSNPINRTDPSGLMSKEQLLATASIAAFLSGSLIGGTRTAIDLIGGRGKHDLTSQEITIIISRNAGLTGLAGVAAVLIGAPIVASGAMGAAAFASLGLGASGVGFAIGQNEIADAQDYHELAVGIFDTMTAGAGLLGSSIGLRAAAIVRPRVYISRSRWPEAAAHISEAQRAGKPKILTIDRAGRSARSKAARRGYETTPGTDLDEYPPAMFREGGAGAHIRSINLSDNRGAGSYTGMVLRPYADGTKVIIEVVP